MVKKGFTEVILKNELADQLRKKIEEERRENRMKPQLSTYVQEVLWTMIENDKALKQSAPFLEIVGIESDVIYIRDWKQSAVSIVSVRRNREGYLYCDFDDKHADNCVHVGFAWAIPEVHRKMRIAGRKYRVIKEPE